MHCFVRVFVCFSMIGLVARRQCTKLGRQRFAWLLRHLHPGCCWIHGGRLNGSSKQHLKHDSTSKWMLPGQSPWADQSFQTSFTPRRCSSTCWWSLHRSVNTSGLRCSARSCATTCIFYARHLHPCGCWIHGGRLNGSKNDIYNLILDTMDSYCGNHPVRNKWSKQV